MVIVDGVATYPLLIVAFMPAIADVPVGAPWLRKEAALGSADAVDLCGHHVISVWKRVLHVVQ